MPTTDAPMPTAAAVHQPLLQGRQPVAAVWFAAEAHGEAERARRLLALWHVGASARRYPGGDLLLCAAPREQDCESLGGWALRRQGRGLCSAPLSAAEAAALPPADVWLVQGGRVQALQLADGQPLDPSEWLQVDGLALHEVHDCRIALPAPAVLAPAEARALREVLDGRVPPASEAQRDFLRELSRRATEGGPAPRPSRPPGPAAHFVRKWAMLAALLWLAAVALGAASGNDLGWLVLPIIALTAWLVRQVGRFGAAGLGQGTGTGAGHGGAAPAPSSPPLPPRARDRIVPQAWRHWLARLALTSRLSALIGRRQAAYMRRMLEMFESGRLDEALRHAIPLGGDGSLGQAFGTPGARKDLSLGTQRGASTSISFGDAFEEHLRSLYRRTFEQLDRAGRIDEAVFVLAELLQARQEALDYLEKKERFAQAAELALAWDQPPAVIVRLQALAGDWRRAVAVARRDNAFRDAVLQLEKRWPDAAARLREEWAQSLALQGDWLAAVDALWPVAARRALAVDWLLKAEAEGGTLGARALVQRALLLPDTLADCADRFEALARDPRQHAERAAFAEALLALKQQDATAQRLMRLVVRGVIADHGAGRGRLPQAELARLVQRGQDRWLDADLPPTPLPVVPRQPLAPHGHLPSPPGRLPEGGGLPLLDAVALNDGRSLVALGEAGAAIVDVHGRIVSRFAVPAERLVISHNRRVALGLAPRDRLWRVSRLDLVSRQATDLGLAALTAFTDTFDGIAWTVGIGRRLCVLDTQRSLHEVLWQVDDLPGEVRVLAVSGSAEQAVLVDERGHLQLWRYQLPQRRLLARGESLADRGVEGSQLLPYAKGGAIEVWLRNESGRAPALGLNLLGRVTEVPVVQDLSSTAALAGPARTGEDLCVVPIRDGDGVHWHVLSLTHGRLHGTAPAWPADSGVAARLMAGACLLFDREGRLWQVDTATSVVGAVTVRV